MRMAWVVQKHLCTRLCLQQLCLYASVWKYTHSTFGNGVKYIIKWYCIFQQGEIDAQQAAGMMQSATAAEIIQSAGGEIQVLHATPEQVAQLQQAHQIQILQGDAAQVMVCMNYFCAV